MSGSDMDDFVDDQQALEEASRNNFDEETQIQLIDDDSLLQKESDG